MPRRTKPMLIAPIIPMMGFLGLLALDRFHGTRWVHTVVGVWCVVMAVLTVYVIQQMMAARRRSR